jgi:lipid-A-disaccharide synthase
MSHPTVLILAGEPSGDLHAAAVVRALSRRVPGARWIGTGGPRLAAEGVELLAGLDRLAVLGFGELIPQLAFLRGLERRIGALLESGVVDLVVLVDYPGFNLRVARRAHRRGVPVLYYIAPKVWAWNPGRTRRLAEDTDRVAVIFPFEAEPLRAAGVDARFVGHPLLEREEPMADKGTLATGLGVAPARPLLALLPGSRRQEIDRHLDRFVAAARLVERARPDLQPVIARAPGIPAELLERAGLPVTIDARALLRHAAAAIVKSGTGTLEAALEGIPFVIAYRTSGFTYAIARRLLRVPFLGLPNLIAGETLVPELIQDDATPERIAGALLPLLEGGSPERARMLAGLERVRGALGTAGASERVAAMAAELLAQRPRASGPPRDTAATAEAS